MSSFKAFLAIGAIAMASFFVGDVTPASASPAGTDFTWTAGNFQGDDPGTVVPFGVPTVTASGVTVDSSVSVSTAFAPLGIIGGLDFIEFSITTDDSGALAGISGDPSSWLISGLNWGPGAGDAVATGLIFISFDIGGTYVALDAGGAVPIVPNPGTLAGVFGADAVPLDIAGDPASAIAWDTFAQFGTTNFGIFTGLLGISVLDAIAIDSMHIGFEVIHVPEPATLTLAGMCLCSTLLMRRRNR
ncbi:MAG: PEP-CTERM sorting domain-containing protein [Planctomycetes bacterium]|nr:PEP-CTERM sorting domain-containing protein [Planctomycetota bacterium]